MNGAFRELDTVELCRDLPDLGLRVGDIGTIVFVYAPDAFEVEFVNSDGDTTAITTLRFADVRAVKAHRRMPQSTPPRR
jgi:hypothetical protein